MTKAEIIDKLRSEIDRAQLDEKCFDDNEDLHSSLICSGYSQGLIKALGLIESLEV